jgi:iron complex outermembrane receptor protein
MKKIILAILFTCAGAVACRGQFTLSGKITDSQTGVLLAGANILIRNTFLGTTSGVDGIFHFKNLEPGTYHLIVSFMGYIPWSKELELSSDTVTDIPMARQSLMQEEVQIVSTRIVQGMPGTYQNVTRETISRMNLGKDIPFLLSSTPSLTTSSDAGNDIGYSGLRIRGTDITRINVTINGIPYNDPESHNVYWVDVPDLASSLDDVQIQRGVGTSANGAATFGGSINFKTQMVDPEPYARIESSFGSFNSMKNKIALGSGLVKDHWTFDARLSSIRSDGYIDRAYSRLKSYYVSGAYYDAKNLVKLISFAGDEETYHAWEGVPGDSLETNRTYNPAGEYIDDQGVIQYYDNQVDKYRQDHYQLLFSHEARKLLIFNAALFYVRGKGYYENYKTDQKLENYEQDIFEADSGVTRSDLVCQKWLDNYFTGITFSTLYNPSEKWQLTGGGAFNYYYGDHYGYVLWARDAIVRDKDKPWYTNTGQKTDFNVYVKGDYFVGKSLRLFGDLQFRNIHYRVKGIHDNLNQIDLDPVFNFFNPKLGAHYALSSRHVVYGLFGIANREPNRRNYLDADEGYQPRPERLYDYELGYTLHLENAEMGLNLYYMNYHDQLVLTGEINNVGDPIMVNVPESYRTGLEVSLSVLIIKNLMLEANLSLSRNKILNFTGYVDNWDTWGQDEHILGLTDISFSPAAIFNGLITYEPINDIKISFISKYVSKQYIDNSASDLRRLDPYFVNHFVFNYLIHTTLIPDIGFNVMVNNLFNAKYETDAWVYRYIYEGQESMMNGFFPQATMNYQVGLVLGF